MSAVKDYPMTRQGVRDLDRPMSQHMVDNSQSEINIGSTERTASSVVGSLLAGIGAANCSLEGLLLMFVGGALVYRGYSGHCPAYAAAGINTAK